MDDLGMLLAHVRRQARGCGKHGSPLSAAVLTAVADDLEAGGPSREVFGTYAGDPDADAVSIRLLGGLHRLVLQGRTPGLAAFYPSVGGDAPPQGVATAVRDALEQHAGELRAGLVQAPQTNEVGRAAALVGGLLHVVARTPLPIRLVEIGASAGLNLRADHFRVDLGDGRGVGPQDSPVVLHDAWQGPSPPTDGRIEVIGRLGCDVAPVDPTTEDGRLTLTSYVWADMTDRLRRLRGALDLAAQVPATVERSGAADFLDRLELRDGVVTVLWHSVMWQYVPAAEQARAVARIDALAAETSESRPFARLAFEPDRPVTEPRYGFHLTLTTWPGGEERVLAVPAPHGTPTTWR